MKRCIKSGGCDSLQMSCVSEPSHLLCVAMQLDTYEKGNGIFDADREDVDLRTDVGD